MIKAEQTNKAQLERNDRLVAMASARNKPTEIRSLKKLDDQLLNEIERFFSSYNELQGKKFHVLGYGGRKAALKIVKKAHERYLKQNRIH